LNVIFFQTKRDTQPKSSVTQRPELVDDFVRNFLVRVNMHRTLDCFQTEWWVFLCLFICWFLCDFYEYVSPFFKFVHV